MEPRAQAIVAGIVTRSEVPLPALVSSLLVLLLCFAPNLAFAGEIPPVLLLIERVSMALGGPDGGDKVLQAAQSLDFTFVRTVRESHSSAELTARHRLLVFGGGERQRLDIRMQGSEGVDSAMVVDGERSWLIVDGAVHPLEQRAVLPRLREFSPELLYSVPLALAAEGRKLLGEAKLTASEGVGEGGRKTFVLLGTDEDGQESARLEIDAKDYRPRSVSFRSPAGQIVYLYDDYREVAPGLVLPFRREFRRNGVRISATDVLRLDLRVKAAPALFDEAVSTLPPIQ